jgi:hypothetical protein
MIVILDKKYFNNSQFGKTWGEVIVFIKYFSQFLNSKLH